MSKRIVTLDGMTLNTLDVFDVANGNATVTIAENAMIRVLMARDVVNRIVDGNETVYGINTGFGSLVHSKI
ncbi:MAG: aromatic amino acid lyase, partial [Candidatus Poseidoniaceae archaeon]|nr:aromatic amino acid lyase [Candidatus Poseidoniaceae archaeon]